MWSISSAVVVLFVVRALSYPQRLRRNVVRVVVFGVWQAEMD